MKEHLDLLFKLLFFIIILLLFTLFSGETGICIISKFSQKLNQFKPGKLS